MARAGRRRGGPKLNLTRSNSSKKYSDPSKRLAGFSEKLKVDLDNSFGSDVASPLVQEDEEDLSTSLEMISNTGVKKFFRFEKQIENLDREFRSFATAACQLGGSVEILSAAFNLRERLTKFLFLFRENATRLYPRKIEQQPRKILSNPSFIHRKRQSSLGGQHVPIVKPQSEGMVPYTQFQSFAKDIVTFLECLDEFAEFTDEAINHSMNDFKGDLEYWSFNLDKYKSQFHSQALRHYLHDLTAKIGDHIDNVAEALSTFIDIGIPIVQFRQKHAAKNLLNLSTVATLFSVVTATTLQSSYGSTSDVLADFVNAFWFSSLVFSIAAAVSSFLGVTWKQAMYRSAGKKVSRMTAIWMKRSPLVFLIMSVACFSVGLVLFTYSSRQGIVTSTIVTILTAVTSFGLAILSAWFTLEQISVRSKIQKLLAETDYYPRVARTCQFSLRWCSPLIVATWRYLRNISDRIMKPEQLPEELLPTTSEFVHHLTIVSHSPLQPPMDQGNISFATGTEAAHLAVSAIAPLAEGRPDENTEMHLPEARKRFINAIRSVIMQKIRPDAVVSLRGGPRTSDIDKLKTLHMWKSMVAHKGLVRHLQFSPNGRYLATSSSDETSVIFRVGNSFAVHHELGVRGSINQVAWSPDGKTLLTRLNRAVKVWSEDGKFIGKIDRRDKKIESIIWLPTGDAFLSVEGTDVVKFDLQGKVLDTYHFEEVNLIDVAVTPECCRLVGTGPSIALPPKPQASCPTSAEKRIIVYNMQTRKTESEAPFANDVGYITMARKTLAILLSPEKATPQLWELRKRERSTLEQTFRIELKRTFALKGPIDIAGPCQFGGKDDQFVLCAGKVGDVHVWNRETATLLHYIAPLDAPGVGGLTCIGWNYATDDPMTLAMGSHDGMIRIYSTSSHVLSDNGSNMEILKEDDEGAKNGVLLESRPNTT